ncbi:hypothetical protein LTR35_018178 [Friedmanniomyces endolithicus]|uniref:Uncharacterized protein n=1 Tax=Friedmanniomyces endolithicus TaxID=329885 RepID=A0AAN6IZ94_9PEZI|nr:hypothetical protein LTR35_018178 [Friedmanniomyces endolithicus]KAK0268144.1 hypothetical protein LTS00_017647 [Friedmanniomyces endolithicus]KAK0303012.1 hypothetical protein LTR82_017676 [Friedmanniomyces endolithicus]KAK0971965.1 hypothetical protein LTR54_017684 [Friedmanniomyces endolithicus]
MLTNVLSQRLSAVKCLQHKWFAASTLSSPGVERGCTAVVNRTSHQFPVYIDEITHEPSLQTLPVELDQLVNSPGSNDADYSSNDSTVADTGVILEGETSNVADSRGPRTAAGSWTATTTQSRLGLSMPDRLRYMVSDRGAEHPASDSTADSEHVS